MPPKPKFTREEITAAAFALVRGRGEDALTARELGAQLGSSARPIFTVFADMGELRAAVRAMAQQRFDDYMAVAEDYTPAFKMRGLQWLRFAQEEPQLFRLLFMHGGTGQADLATAVRANAFGSEQDVAIIMRDYHASEAQAAHLFHQMWVYTYGLCVLCATGECTFSERELAARLGEVFCGMIHVLTSGMTDLVALQPVRHDAPDSAFVRTLSPDLGSSTEKC